MIAKPKIKKQITEITIAISDLVKNYIPKQINPIIKIIIKIANKNIHSIMFSQHKLMERRVILKNYLFIPPHSNS